MLCLCIGIEVAFAAKRFPVFNSPSGQIQPIVAPTGGNGFLVLGLDKNRLAARRVEVTGGGEEKLFPLVLLPSNERGRWLAIEPDLRRETFLAVWSCHVARLCGSILDRFGRRLGPRFVISLNAPIGSTDVVRAQIAHDWVRKRWLVMWKTYGNWAEESFGFRILDEDGDPLGPPRSLAGGESFGYDAPSDTLLVAWNEWDPQTGSGMVAQFLSSAGRPLGPRRVLDRESSPPFVHWTGTGRRWLVTWICRGNDLCGRFFGDKAAIPSFRLKMKEGSSGYLASIGHAPSRDRYLISWRVSFSTGVDEIWAQWLAPGGTSLRRRIRVSHRKGFVPANHGQFTACSPDRPLCLVVWSGARKNRFGDVRNVFGRFLGLGADPE